MGVLLAQMLQQAGLQFMEAQARHKGGRMRSAHILCETEEQAAAIRAWGEREKYDVTVTVATPEEVVAWKKRQDMLGEF